jgi:mannobiose 2-epimerase
MLEAEDVVGHGHDPTTTRWRSFSLTMRWRMAGTKNLAGFYQDGARFGKPVSRRKEWWLQREGLNSLLLMQEKYGGQTDVYFKAFQPQWNFIKNYQIDNEFHGVYERVGPDGSPVNANKGRIWKAAYHDGRDD